MSSTIEIGGAGVNRWLTGLPRPSLHRDESAHPGINPPAPPDVSGIKVLVMRSAGTG
jgi:hypothetical protein